MDVGQHPRHVTMAELEAGLELIRQEFVARFGLDAMKFVNSPVGRRLRLRGLYAKVLKAGMVRTGDLVQRAW